MKKFLIFIMAVLCLACTSCSQAKDYTVNDYRTTMQFYDGFKVMQLTDLHLGVQGDLQRNLDFVSKLIDEADPDLIVVTGDSFMYANKNIVNLLFELLNTKCKELTTLHPERLTKFAVTFGNHDNQGDYHKYYINNVILSYATKDGKEVEDSKYAAFIDYEDDNLNGYANYYIDLVDDRNKSVDEVDVKYRLHIIDSNSYHYIGPKYKYEVILEDQLQHVENIYKTATKDTEYVGLGFFHIPFQEFEIAKDKYKEIKSFTENGVTYGQGEFREGVGDPYCNNGSYRSLRNSNVIAYFVGHEHINYCDVIYNHESDNIMDKGILSYGVKSTDQLYHDDDILGYKLIILKDNTTVEDFLTIEYITNNIKNVIDRGVLYGEQ